MKQNIHTLTLRDVPYTKIQRLIQHIYFKNSLFKIKKKYLIEERTLIKSKRIFLSLLIIINFIGKYYQCSVKWTHIDVSNHNKNYNNNKSQIRNFFSKTTNKQQKQSHLYNLNTNVRCIFYSSPFRDCQMLLTNGVHVQLPQFIQQFFF